VWQEEGMCEKEKDYMTRHCPVSCKLKHAKANTAVACVDAHPRCKVWADLGECAVNRNMKKYCTKSCDWCDESAPGIALEEEEDLDCIDDHTNCEFWAEKGECTANPTYMLANCKKSCGSCAKVTIKESATRVLQGDDAILEESTKYGVKQRAEGDRRVETIARLEEALNYMESEQVTHLPAKLRETCKNRHELCSFWAVIGECQNNAAYMATNCAVVCMSCHLIDFETRCPPLPDAVPALLPGDMNKMFERIVATAPGNRTLTETERKELVADNMTEYTVTVHSRPSDEPSTEISVVVDKSLPPWVITFDNFLRPEECDALIALGYKYEYKRSQDVGATKFDGSHEGVQSTRRTSENAWCSDHHGCRKEELAVKIHERMSKVMGIPPENSEDLQMLKYEKGQFYRSKFVRS
jgi:prolyl 4-hydroxylase